MKWKTIIAVILTLGALVSYLVVSTGFVEIKQQDLVCKELQVTICDSLVNSFIRPADIDAILTSEGVKIIGERITHINVYDMEQLLNTRNVIKNTVVFTSIDGVLHINVYQRRPIMRMQALTGNFYIDETGYIFPLSGVHTSYVPVMTGNVPMNIPIGFRGEIPAKENFLQQAYHLALFLDENDIWQSQVTQLDVANVNNVTMIPREGKQIIYLGPLDNYEYKFNKLLAYYSKVSPANDTTYVSIDLRYSNQVVCTKR